LMKLNKKNKRLMKNPYPLPVLGWDHRQMTWFHIIAVKFELTQCYSWPLMLLDSVVSTVPFPL
jgi:hypothetical protein